MQYECQRGVVFSTTPLWHSYCIIPSHELLSYISALPIQRVVLADRLPIGNVESMQQPDYFVHPEPIDGILRTKAGEKLLLGPRCGPVGRDAFTDEGERDDNHHRIQ